MAKSILQTKKRCIVCRYDTVLHEHHVYEGSRHGLSERYGLKVWLCPRHHNASDESIHLDPTHRLEKDLKQWAQRKAMEHYGWTVEDFIEIMGKNYLEEEE